MLTVVIYINQVPILSRSCHRVQTGQRSNVYKVDDGRTIVHKGEDGAVKLAIKLLEGIKNTDEG